MASGDRRFSNTGLDKLQNDLRMCAFTNRSRNNSENENKNLVTNFSTENRLSDTDQVDDDEYVENPRRSNRDAAKVADERRREQCGIKVAPKTPKKAEIKKNTTLQKMKLNIEQQRKEARVPASQFTDEEYRRALENGDLSFLKFGTEEVDGNPKPTLSVASFLGAQQEQQQPTQQAKEENEEIDSEVENRLNTTIKHIKKISDSKMNDVCDFKPINPAKVFPWQTTPKPEVLYPTEFSVEEETAFRNWVYTRMDNHDANGKTASDRSLSIEMALTRTRNDLGKIYLELRAQATVAKQKLRKEFEEVLQAQKNEILEMFEAYKQTYDHNLKICAVQINKLKERNLAMSELMHDAQKQTEEETSELKTKFNDLDGKVEDFFQEYYSEDSPVVHNNQSGNTGNQGRRSRSRSRSRRRSPPHQNRPNSQSSSDRGNYNNNNNNYCNNYNRNNDQRRGSPQRRDSPRNDHRRDSQGGNSNSRNNNNDWRNNQGSNDRFNDQGRRNSCGGGDYNNQGRRNSYSGGGRNDDQQGSSYNNQNNRDRRDDSREYRSDNDNNRDRRDSHDRRNDQYNDQRDDRRNDQRNNDQRNNDQRNNDWRDDRRDSGGGGCSGDGSGGGIDPDEGVPPERRMKRNIRFGNSQMVIRLDRLREFRVEYTSHNKYQPYQYIQKFERRMDQYGVSESQYCDTFTALIDETKLVHMAAWKELQESATDYYKLRQDFLNCAWSRQKQTEARNCFQALAVDRKSSTTQAAELLMWLKIFKTTSTPEDEIIMRIYGKLSTSLRPRFTEVELQNIDVFERRLNNMTKIEEFPQTPTPTQQVQQQQSRKLQQNEYCDKYNDKRSNYQRDRQPGASESRNSAANNEGRRTTGEYKKPNYEKSKQYTKVDDSKNSQKDNKGEKKFKKPEKTYKVNIATGEEESASDIETEEVQSPARSEASDDSINQPSGNE
ncbi:putative uncharacterized protein DDB_G0282133 [Planococcus citri]|uniref:putative uncharacterized protein DDB_G0282133 n=1 Tax=Planococcus citri TaxID=170843 RepID=UPI0031F80737